MHIHFVGIRGSGISGVACIAASRGFKVSGCDNISSSKYSAQFEDVGIKVEEGHDLSHVEKADVVAVSPALLYKDKYKGIPELVEAKEKGILMKWQEFIAKYVFKGQNIVAICGTHGKTTTTSLTGLALEAAGVDPTVLVGGIVKKWDKSFRNGASDCFVVEADEYDNNFIYYNPRYLVLNNIEMEHPEIFNSFEEYESIFINFINTIQDNGVLIFNADNKKNISVVKKLHDGLKEKGVKIVGYTTKKDTIDLCDSLYKTDDFSVKDHISLIMNGREYVSNLIGMHNVYNIMAVYALTHEMGAENLDMQEVLNSFTGAERRLEIILDNDKVTLYDDYAHHHRQVRACIESLKKAYPDNNVIAVLEPHQISRIVHNTKEYMESMSIADRFFITKIFKGREMDMAMPDVNAMISGYEDRGAYMPDSDELVDRLVEIVKSDDKKTIVIVMGAGISYKISEKLQKKLA